MPARRATPRKPVRFVQERLESRCLLLLGLRPSHGGRTHYTPCSRMSLRRQSGAVGLEIRRCRGLLLRPCPFRLDQPALARPTSGLLLRFGHRLLTSSFEFNFSFDRLGPRAQAGPCRPRGGPSGDRQRFFGISVYVSAGALHWLCRSGQRHVWPL